VSSLNRATSGQLVVDSISNIGPHYARTLREWRRCFVDNFAEIEQALRKDYPGVFDSEQDERGAHELAVFRRKWLCKKNSIMYVDFRDWLINSFFHFPLEQITCASVLFIWENSGLMLPFCPNFSCYCEIGFTTRMLGGKAFIYFIPRVWLTMTSWYSSYNYVHA